MQPDQNKNHPNSNGFEDDYAPTSLEDIRMMPTMLFNQPVGSVSVDQSTKDTEKLVSQTPQKVDRSRFPTPEKDVGDRSTKVPPNNPRSNQPKQKTDDSDQYLQPGTIIDGRYRVVNVLGVGGLAVVYRAIHMRLEREIAVKVMNVSGDKAAVERFYREAKIASGIFHRNVVEVFDYGVIPETSQPYMAMELLHGHDLFHEISENGPLDPKRAFQLLRPVLDALNVGHKQGIVHKDLKPENLFLVNPGTPDEYLKILDFGVARINSGGSSKLTMAGQIMGTPRFLAPEYILTQQVFPATDVYQMALIFSESITGKQAVSNDITLAIQAHCSGDLKIPLCLKQGAVGSVFSKALSMQYNNRYENAGAFGAALDTVKDAFENMKIGGKSTPGAQDSAVSFNHTLTIVLIVAISILIVALFVAIII